MGVMTRQGQGEKSRSDCGGRRACFRCEILKDMEEFGKTETVGRRKESVPKADKTGRLFLFAVGPHGKLMTPGFLLPSAVAHIRESLLLLETFTRFV